MHDHVQRPLSAEQSALVAQRLRPGQATQIRALMKALEGSQRRSRRWLWVAEAAAAVLLVGWGWSWWKAPKPVLATASFVLQPGNFRGTETQRLLHVPPGTQAIRFELPAKAVRAPDGDYELREPGGATYSFALTRR